jgi:hypothetical protein
MSSGHVPEGLVLGSVGPWQEVVDLAVEMALDDFGERVGEIGLRIDAGEFAGFNQRGKDRPVFSAAVRRDVMMPGIWAARLSSPIRSIRYSESAPSSSPIRCMVAPAT